jgi:FKBP-type peptidyl-prolyl cis-trans isomerase FkpA
MRKFSYLLLLPVLLFSCKDQSKIDQQIILSYISAHHLNAIAEPGGLYYVPITSGSGGAATYAQQVSVTFKGYLTNDSVFSSSTVPYTIALSEAIPGWQEGIPLMQRGGRATFLIPSALGYASQAQPGIPANSVLIFDVDLIAWQ